MDPINSGKILITGGTGFIGVALCRSLDAQQFATRVLVRDSVKACSLNGLSSVERFVGDLLDIESLVKACAGQQTVVHLAGTAHVNANTGLARTTIVDGTRNLLEAAIRCKLKRIVYVSSSLAQVLAAGAGDITEYGRLKLAAEQLLQAANSRGLIEIVILRPVNVYGIGMQGNIAGMIAMIARNRLPPLPALDTRISLIGVQDLVQALTLAITVPKAKGKTFTVTDGEHYKVTDIENAIYQSLGKRFPQWRTPRVVLFAAALLAELVSRLRSNDSAIGLRTYRNITHDNIFDNSVICRELGFLPTTRFYQELPQIIEHILQNTKAGKTADE